MNIIIDLINPAMMDMGQNIYIGHQNLFSLDTDKVINTDPWAIHLKQDGSVEFIMYSNVGGDSSVFAQFVLSEEPPMPIEGEENTGRPPIPEEETPAPEEEPPINIGYPAPLAVIDLRTDSVVEEFTGNYTDYPLGENGQRVIKFAVSQMYLMANVFIEHAQFGETLLGEVNRYGEFSVEASPQYTKIIVQSLQNEIIKEIPIKITNIGG